MLFDNPRFFPLCELGESVSSRQTAELFLTPPSTRNLRPETINHKRTVNLQCLPYPDHEQGPSRKNWMAQQHRPNFVHDIRRTPQLVRHLAIDATVIHELQDTSRLAECRTDKAVQLQQPGARGVGDFQVWHKEEVKRVPFCKVALSMQQSLVTRSWMEDFIFDVGNTTFTCNECRLSMACKPFQLRIESVKWEVLTRFVAKCHRSTSLGSETATFGCAICRSTGTNFRSRNELWAHLETHSTQDIESDSDIKRVR